MTRTPQRAREREIKRKAREVNRQHRRKLHEDRTSEGSPALAPAATPERILHVEPPPEPVGHLVCMCVCSFCGVCVGGVD